MFTDQIRLHLQARSLSLCDLLRVHRSYINDFSNSASSKRFLTVADVAFLEESARICREELESPPVNVKDVDESDSFAGTKGDPDELTISQRYSTGHVRFGVWTQSTWGAQGVKV